MRKYAFVVFTVGLLAMLFGGLQASAPINAFAYGGGTVPSPAGAATSTVLTWSGSSMAWSAITAAGVDTSGNITPANLTWGAGATSPTVQQTAPGSDLTTQAMTLAPQAPFASAVTHIQAGSLVAALASPASGTTQSNEATFRVKRGAQVVWDMAWGPAVGGQFGSTASLVYPEGNNSTTNYSLGANTTTTYLNGASIVGLQVAGGSPAIKCQSAVGFGLPLQGNGTTPAQWNPASQAITTGTTTLSTAANYIKLTGSMSGNVTLVLQANDGTEEWVDSTQITFNAHTITYQANAANLAHTSTTAEIIHTFYNSAAGKLFAVVLTP